MTEFYIKTQNENSELTQLKVQHLLNQNTNVSLAEIKTIVKKFSFVFSIIDLKLNKIIWAIGKQDCKTYIDTYFEKNILINFQKILNNSESLTPFLQKLNVYPHKNVNVVLDINLFDNLPNKLFTSSIRLLDNNE